MKRKNVSRITALGLCGTMLLSGAAGLTAHASEEEPLSFKVTTVYFGDQSPENTKIQEEWIKLCEEKLGRKLDITFEYIHTGDYTEKLQVINAGGDLPDILTCYSTNSNAKLMVDEYGSKGLFLDLAERLDDMPNYKSYLDKDPQSQSTLYTPEGNLYGAYNLSIVPTGSAHGAFSTMMAVKNSVLKDLDLEIPTTLDEVYDVAKAIKDAGVSKYPIVQLEEWQNPEDVVFNAYHTASNRYYDGTEFKYGPLSDDYKQALQYLNKIYTEGLISPDYFTYTTDMGNADLESGTACILPSAWEGYPGAWADERPEDEWVAVPIADELVKFVDAQYDEDVINLLNWGIEGETYEMKDGKKSLIVTKDQYAEYGMPVSGSMRSGIFPQPQDMDLWRIEISEPAPIYWNGEIVTDKLVAFSSSVMNESNTTPRDGQPNPSISADESSEYANIMTPVETYAKEQKVKFIKGDRSFDEWDSYIEEINKMGDIQAAMDIYNSKISK